MHVKPSQGFDVQYTNTFVGNYLGGMVVADQINAPGYSSAGFENISTSDNIVHGVVKQSATSHGHGSTTVDTKYPSSSLWSRSKPSRACYKART